MAESSVKKERSRAYPVMPLADALVRIASINENLGIQGKFNRETIATGMGYNGLNGASARAVAALTHYGFLDREKDLYTLSGLAKKYLMPMEDNDISEAMYTAAVYPVLFSEIYNAFKGQVIPKQFANRLVHEFGIQQKAAPEVERIFKETMETAGILKDNNTLRQNAESANQIEKPNDENKAGNSPNAIVRPETHIQGFPQSGFLTVKLPSGLVIQYEQILAPAFAFGQFGIVLKNLDDSVAQYLSDHVVVKSSEQTDE